MEWKRSWSEKEKFGAVFLGGKVSRAVLAASTALWAS